MASCLHNRLNDKNNKEFSNILENQDLIENINYKYSNINLLNDFACLLSKDKHLKDNSLLKIVILDFHQ